MGEFGRHVWIYCAPLLFPWIWSATITLVCSLLFWLVRWRSGLTYGFGTELFAVLMAVDISVYFGVVEAARLLGNSWLVDWIGPIAVGLMMLTLAACLYSVEFERRAIEAKGLHSIALEAEQDLPSPHFRDYVRYVVRAAVVRYIVSTVHLWWIVKTPRWALLQ